MSGRHKPEPATDPRTALRRDVVVILLASTACLLPFLDKPLHVDDPLFVWTAKHITSNPGNFYGYELNWGLRQAPMHVYTQNPPLACYWLAMVGSVAGFHEIALHLGMLLMTWAALLGTYAVARQMCGQPRCAALVALSMPVFLISATTLMCDVMLTALWSWSVAAWLAAHRRNSVPLLFVASILAALAALTKYFGVALVPLLLAYAVCTRPRALWAWSLAALVLPIAVMAGYEALTWHLYGQGLLSGAMNYAQALRGRAEVSGPGLGGLALGGLAQKLASAIVYPGGCVLSLALLIPWLGGRRWWLAIGISVVVFNLGALAIAPRPTPESMLNYRAHMLAFSLAGTALWALTAVDLYQRRDADSLLLTLWIVGTIVFAIFVNWTTNGRSILPLVPAAAIVAVRRLESLEWTSAAARRWGWQAAVGLAAVLALVVARADYVHAVANRDMAQRVIALSQKKQRRVWYFSNGDFQYYLEPAGLPAIDVDRDSPAPGDFYFLPAVKDHSGPLAAQSFEPVDELRIANAWPGSTQSKPACAGFYSTNFGPLPFTLLPAEDFIGAISLIRAE